MSQVNYKKVFEPVRIGTLEIKNRIVLPPMGTGYSEERKIGSRLLDYYEARARGGTGLIITEGVAPGVKCQGPRQLTLGDNGDLTGWQKLVKAVHQHGAKIAVQLHHAGYEHREGAFVQVAPSSIRVPSRMIGVMGGPPHELTIGEIEEMVRWFADAAKRARDVGIDAVEIHGAHQYIVASFLSSASNKRLDKYGGSLENKARFLIEIIEAMRAAVGPDYPIWPRLNIQEYGVEEGITLEETKQVVGLAVKAGVDAVHASAYGAFSFITKAPLPDTVADLVPLAEEIKKITAVPVIAVGRLDLETGEKALLEGKADLVAIGRRLIADPDLPNKTAEGRLDDIISCIGCFECIERLGSRDEGLICTINQATGREGARRIQPATQTKKVWVVGSGPAGLEAARVAALRGHKVTLLEKDQQLGGQLRIAVLPPNKGDILPWLNYLIRQLEMAGVEIRLNTEATPEAIAREKPEAVILSVGGIPIWPEIPGINETKGGTPVVTAQEVLWGKKQTGQNVVVIGGGLVGCETGHYLAQKGKKVTIIEMLKRMASEMGPMVRRRLLDGLKQYQVVMVTEAKCEEISAAGVTVTLADGGKKLFPADSVILAAGYQTNDSLFKILQDRVPEVHCVGDASHPQGIMEAVRDGYFAGLSV
ncbi:MAG: FAD-dependent oxidoreductase [Deltaproteobacteria bacterium]|nr:FAD-dependent oxidoreductase [Deltaproteobacteria bacterium]